MTNKREPTQARAEKSREVILDCALALFREKGYDATTMKDVAAKAGMAVGASYYHFRSKEDLVFSYYLNLLQDEEAQVESIVKSSKDISTRFRCFVEFKFKQLGQDRKLVQVLTRTAADPQSTLSPFASETSRIREGATAICRQLIEGSNFTAAKDLSERASFLFWLHYMGLTFFWSHDRSRDQKLSHALLTLTTPLLVKMSALTKVPLTKGISAKLVQALDTVRAAMEEGSASEGQLQ